MSTVAAANLFVVFEGIDGSGKTTLSNRVAARLRERGLKVAHVRENGRFASSVTQSIRELGRDQRNLALTPRAELLLSVARDVQLLEESTLPALRSCDVVLADRFLYTAEVLAEHGRGLPVAEVAPVVQAAAHGVQPDVVVLFDVDPHLARARRQVAKITAAEARPSSRKGLAGMGMQHRLRAGYRELAERDPARWVVVDNSEASLAVVEEMLVEGLLAARGGDLEPLHARAGALAQGSGPVATASTLAEARHRFLEWIDRRALSEPDVAAWMLGSAYGPGIDERRLALAARSPVMIAHGLRGLDDTVSWRLRRELCQVAPHQVAASLVGEAGAGPEAAGLRTRLVATAPAEVAASLMWRDDTEAWVLRENLRGEPLAVLAALGGLASPRAWSWRDQQLAGELASWELADAACQSVTGLDGERAWAVRDRAYPLAPVSAVQSLLGTNDERAREWRERHLERAPKAVMKSIIGLDDDHSWSLRERAAPWCKEAVDSMAGMGSLRAWALRERCRDLWPSTVARSLGSALALTARGRELFGHLLSHHAGVAMWRAAAAVQGLAAS